MASMQHDFIHPRQLEDVKSIKAAIKSFTTNMKRMMLLMKDLGTTLEHVSHSFDALTSLSFSDEGVKQYVHHFSEEVVLMMEGTAFQNYNKLVHEEVLAPVEQLKASLKVTEKAAKTEKSNFDRYKKAKSKVDKHEKSYAAKRKSLDESKSYPASVQSRDTALSSLQQSKDDFEVKFVSLVNEVEKVTATTLKRYLDLNAGYMTSVIDALTKTDPTVEEAVALYREEQRQQRQSAIQQRCAEVDTEMSAPYASQGYRLDPTRTSRAPPSATASPQKGPGAVSAQSGNQQVASSAAAASPAKSQGGGGTPPAQSPSPHGPPAAAVPAAASKKGPPPAAAAAASPVPKVTSSSLPPANAPVTQRGAFTVTNTAAAAGASGGAGGGAAVPAAAPAASTVSRIDDDVDDEDFGSVSQVGTAGQIPPPLYNFSRGPLSQVSSVRPQSGYVAHQDANLTDAFLRKMESDGLTPSEVNASRQQ